jgi:chromosome segregation and condensation protein ScpB
MNVTVQIPDDLAPRIMGDSNDLSREALELIAAEAYRQDRITKPELRRLLGIETSYQLDGFLKAHDIWIDYSMEDAERERRALDRLGL